MSNTFKSKKRSGFSGSNGNRKNGGGNNSEPTEQEMVMFQRLLREQNASAKEAHAGFSTSQNKAQFYADIISVCRTASSSKISPSVSSNSNSNSSGALPTSSAGDNSVEVGRRQTLHNISKATPAQDKPKPLCTFFSSKGTCRKGKKCRFMHPEGKLENNRWVAPLESSIGDTKVVTTSATITLDSSSSTEVAESTASAPLESGTSDGIGRANMPRTTSVDNAMGLMDMDMRYLEENLDMRLGDKSDSSGEEVAQEGHEVEDQEFSQLFRDLIAGRLDGDSTEISASDVTWMSLNNSEQPKSSPPPSSISFSKEASPLQPLSTLAPPPAVSHHTTPERGGHLDPYGSTMSSQSAGSGVGNAESSEQISSIFNEVISDVINEVSTSFHQQQAQQQRLPLQDGRVQGSRSESVMPQRAEAGGDHRLESGVGAEQFTGQQQVAQEQRQQLLQGRPSGPAYGHPYGPHGLPPGMPPHMPPPYPMYGYSHPQQQGSPLREMDSLRNGYRPQQQVGAGHEGRGQPGPSFAPPPGAPGYGYGCGPQGFPFPAHPQHMGQFLPPPLPHPGYGYPPGMYGHPAGMPHPPSPQHMQQVQHEHFMQQQPPHQQLNRREVGGEGRAEQGSLDMHSRQRVDDAGLQRQDLHCISAVGNFANAPQRPDSFSTEDFVHLTSTSPLLVDEDSMPVENKNEPEEEEPTNSEPLPPPAAASAAQGTTTPVESMKSQKLLSFLKSNVKSDLPSVMAVKFSPPASDKHVSEGDVTSAIQEAARKLSEDSKQKEKEPKKAEVQQYYRSTKKRMGSVRITKPAAGPLTVHSSRHAILPGGHLSLAWELSSDLLRDAPKAHLVIALTRLGSMNNTNNIIAKTLRAGKAGGGQYFGGNISFHAPKAAGYYVFRIYDQTDDETKAQTLATSPVFAVELKGRDVTTNLAFILSAFSSATKNSKVDNGAINGLKNVFELMRTTGAIVNSEKPPQQLLQDCVQLLLNMMFKQMSMFDLQAELLAAQQEAASDVDAPKTSAGTTEDWQSIRSAQKMHMTTYDCLIALRSNKIAMGMLTGEQRSGVNSVIGLYSPLLSRFFKNFADLQAACSKEIGFDPAPLDPSFRSLCLHTDPQVHGRCQAVLQELTQSIDSVSGELIPPASFATDREDIRQRLQQLLRVSGVVPATCSLVLFGSSKNNFGAEGADLDMCLQYSRADVMPVGEERGHVIEQLGEVMAREGMLEVQARSTARIPILLFKDCISGIDCDISFNNPLAVHNTALLATYSRIDHRVRALAFAIKHWAKRREINSPQNGTLSSYGYLLCLIHFLQTRGLVPDLQNLPPNWDPQSPSQDPAPVRLESHPVEGIPCNTYFYEAARNHNGLQKLKKFSSQNRQTLGELLMDFFRYFAYDFDYRRDIVSIHREGADLLRGGGRGLPVTKLSKMESSCWGSHERLSVEDPFETWYDVAHVLKSTQMTYIRAEFLRAYTLMFNAATSEAAEGVAEESLFERVCARPTTAPKFVVKQQQQADRRSRSNTISSEA